MRTLHFKLFIIALSFIGFAFTNPGDVRSETPFYDVPDTVEVSGTRIPQKAGESGRRIHIIDGSALNEMPVSSVDELLRYIPGVEVQSRNLFGVQSDISMRGSTFNQVLVLIDGMRLNDPMTGHFNSYIPVVPEEIRRIEVIQGPSAAVYGPDAVGGVINIVTKVADRGSDGESEAGMSYYRGEHRLSKAEGGVYTRSGNWNLSGGFQSMMSDGHAIDDNRNADFNINTFSAAAGRELNEQWYISARAGYDYRDFSAVNFYTPSPVDSSRETVTSFWSQLALQREGENSLSRIEAAYRNAEDSFVFQKQFPANINHTQRYMVHASHMINLTRQWSVQGGLQGDLRSIQSRDRGDHDDLLVGAYIIGMYSPLEQLMITASGRIDRDDNFGTELTPQLSASWKYGRMTLRSTAAKSIRSADFTERYNNYNVEAELPAGQNLGNPELLAEQAWNFELGADMAITSFLSASATGFWREGTDLIDYVLTLGSDIDFPGMPALAEPDEHYFFAQNIHSLRTLGGEFTLNGSTRWGDRGLLSYQSGITIMESTSPDDGEITKYIAGHADLLQQNSLQFRTGNLSIGVNSIYKVRESEESEPLDIVLDEDYFVLNVSAGWKMDPFPLTIRAEVKNIMDQSHYDVLGSRLPGRWITGGLSFKY